MLSIRYAEACVEILDILKHMDIEDVKKVSGNFMIFLRDNASKNYICKLDYSKELNDMDIKKETRGLLAIMYEKYWCPEEEKQDLRNKFNKNEQEYLESLREKYNPDNLFNKQKKEKEYESKEQVNSIAMVEYKESIFTRIKKWFKRIF